MGGTQQIAILQKLFIFRASLMTSTPHNLLWVNGSMAGKFRHGSETDKCVLHNHHQSFQLGPSLSL
jgi:hypothetical protein